MTETLPPGERRTHGYYYVVNTPPELTNSELAGIFTVTLDPYALYGRVGGQWLPLFAVDPNDPALLAAAENLAGVVEIATAAEIQSGATGNLAVNAAGLRAELDRRDGLTKPVRSFVRLYKTSNQAVASGATDPVTWQAAEHNIGGGADAANNRVLIPAGKAGLWKVRVELRVGSVTDGLNARIHLLRNGTIVDTEENHAASTWSLSARLYHEAILAAGDALTVQMFSGSFASTITSGLNNSAFVAEFVGAA